MRALIKSHALTKNFFVHPKKKFYFRRFKYALRMALLYPRIIDQLESFFAATPLRQQIFAIPGLRELFYLQQIRACFYHKSKRSDRMHFLQSHFSLLENIHTPDIIEQMYKDTINPLVFTEGEHVLAFKVLYHLDIAREGLLRFDLYFNQEIVSKITFWIMEHGGQRTLCISALQGGKVALETNRLFTKELWGLRPQNLGLIALRCYARSIGIEQIYTFPKEKMWSKKINDQTAIAEFWEEQGARPVPNTPFLRLHLETQYKELSEIASKKRSMYKKRYEFLARLHQALEPSFNAYLKNPGEINEQAAYAAVV